MPEYDFTTIPDRSKSGSYKWMQMLSMDPEVSEGVLPMSVADMEFYNAPEIIEGLKEHLDTYIFGYTAPTESYYDAVIDWFKRRQGVEVKKKWIVHTPGVVNAIFHAIRAFTRPKDRIMIMRPVYPPFFNSVKQQGRKIENCPLKIKHGRYEIDFKLLESQATSKENKVMLFCSPHNPVGRVWTKEEITRVADICYKHDILLIADEIHGDIVMDGNKFHSFLELDHPIREQLIVMTSASKTFNIAGAGIATTFIPDKKIRKRFQAALEESGTHVSNGLAYKTVELAYNESEAWFDEVLKVIQHNRDLVVNFFKDTPIKVYPLEGTYLLWLDFNALKLSNKGLAKFMAEAGIFAHQGHAFGDEGDGFQRWNLAMPTSALEAALERYTEAVARLKP